MIGVDGGESTELEAVDESEDGGAAGGDVVVGEEDVEVTEGVVDALGGLEALVAGKEGGFEVEGVGFHPLPSVRETEKLAGDSTGSLQRRPEVVRCWQRVESGTVVVLGDLAFIFFPFYP